MSKSITAILIGAGQRGARVYGDYILHHNDEIKMIGVAEPDSILRNSFVKDHKIEEKNVFTTWEDILTKERFADLVFICTQDKMHFPIVKAAIEKGYDIVCEKPMSPYAKECVDMKNLAKKYNCKLTICHVLRYSPYFSKIKEIIDSSIIGDIVNIVQIENVAYWHQAHSFVRGNWRREDEAAPMILAKSCHDLDIINYLVDKKCKKVSSFGALKHFKESQAPEGATLRCKDCKVKDCPYNAYHIYLETDEWFTDVIKNVVSPPDGKKDAVIKALDTGPYGRCVYHCDNDVVDHQIVNLEFEDNIHASFTMSAFTLGGGRSVNIMGTHGQIIGEMEENTIIVNNFLNGSSEKIIINAPIEGHSGSDSNFMDSVVKNCSDNKKPLSSAEQSVMSHLMALAAQESLISGRTIDLETYIENLEK